MNTYILGRVAAVVPVLLGVSLLVSSMIFFLPGDPAQLMLSEMGGAASGQVTQEQYEQMNAGLSKQGAPTGILIHICGPMPGGWRIADVWESWEAFERFTAERLIPAMVAVGGPRPARQEVYATYHAGIVLRSQPDA